MTKPRKSTKALVLAALTLLWTAFYVAIAWWVPSRHVSGRVLMWSLVGAALLSASGLILGGKNGRRGAILGCVLLLGFEIALVALVLCSAAFLYGVYGSFGRGAAMIALLIVILSVEIIAMLPAVTLAYLFSHQGRREFGDAS